jgi:outer membrane biosynthesis protein TonB
MAAPVKKQALKDIDLDITHYDTDELLAMLNLQDPTEDDIVNATTRLINKATADRLPKVAAFFQDAQDTLLDELDKQSPPEPQEEQEEQEDPDPQEEQEEQEQEQPDPQEQEEQEEQEEDPEQDPDEGLTQEDNTDSTQLNQWWRNQYLRQADKVQASKPADRKNKIQVLQGNRHMPTKREKLGVNETYQVPVTQGTLNPNLKNTVTRLVNIDSQYRQIITPNSENPLGPASPTNYTVDLTENLTNVLSIKLNSIQIPYAWYALDYTSGTNVLFYRITGTPTYTPFVVPPGNYTPSQLYTYMASVAPFSGGTPFSIAYNGNSGKMTITNATATAYDILFFSPTYNIPVTPGAITPEINDAIAASKLNSNLGWLMGYRGTKPVPNQLLYRLQPVATAPANAIVSEALADTYGPKYLLLVLDDYNQNHLNKGLVNIATNDTRLSLPSYFNPGLAVVCDTSGNPTYVQSAPRQLTQAQLYSINAINQNRNNTTTDRYTGPTTTDVLALIPLKTYSLLPGQPYVEFGSSLQTNERIYFGPVNIERMKVQLIDDKGNILNMHGNDWSFTITSTHLYEY